MDEDYGDILHVADRLKALMLLGPALMVLGVFLAWVSFWGFNISGWSLLTDSTGYYGISSAYVPGLILAIGILALIFRLPRVLKGTELSFESSQGWFVVRIAAYLIAMALMFVFSGDVDGTVGFGYIMSFLGILVSIGRPLIERFS